MPSRPLQRITLVGAGNVAWHLAPELTRVGCEVLQVFSQDLNHAQELAEQIGATPINDLSRLDLSTDLILLAVKDDALADVIAALPQDIPVAHTSGSVGMEIFPQPLRGVFYPLQTFSKGRKLTWTKIPICIEASNKALEENLIALAQKMSKQVHTLDSEKRSKLHVAAVFACNFTNHLLGLSSDLLREENLDTHLLDALVNETISKALKGGAHAMQTGPAHREDQEVLKQHLAQLEQYPRLLELYAALSNSIIDTKNGKEL